MAMTQVQKLRRIEDQRRERQTRYRERQKNKGMQALSFPATNRTFDFLVSERDSTGQTTSQIIDRLVAGHIECVTSNVESVTKDKTETVESVIQAMRANGAAWSKVADRLNKKGFQTKRNKPWTGVNANMHHKRHMTKG